MKKILWDWISGLNLGRKVSLGLFLMLNVIYHGLIGFVLWLIIGKRIFGNHVDWMICFIGYPAILGGFLTGILYAFKYE